MTIKKGLIALVSDYKQEITEPFEETPPLWVQRTNEVKYKNLKKEKYDKYMYTRSNICKL